MKKILISLFVLTALSMAGISALQAGPTVFVNLGPYGNVGYPGYGYAGYPVNNGCCNNGCGNNYPAPYYPASYYPYNNYNNQNYNQTPNNPYVFDNVNSPWASAAGRIVPIRMNPRNPYGY